MNRIEYAVSFKIINGILQKCIDKLIVDKFEFSKLGKKQFSINWFAKLLYNPSTIQVCKKDEKTYSKLQRHEINTKNKVLNNIYSRSFVIVFLDSMFKRDISHSQRFVPSKKNTSFDLTAGFMKRFIGFGCLSAVTLLCNTELQRIARSSQLNQFILFFFRNKIDTMLLLAGNLCCTHWWREKHLEFIRSAFYS